MRCAAKIEIGGADTRRQGSVALGGLLNKAVPAINQCLNFGSVGPHMLLSLNICKQRFPRDAGVFLLLQRPACEPFPLVF